MISCPACGANLDNVSKGEPCPVCGGQTVEAEGSFSPGLSFPPATIITQSNFEDGTRQTVVAHPRGRSTSTLTPDGQPAQEFEGRPSQGEGNVPDALHRLRDTLNTREGSEVWTEHAGHKHEDETIDGWLESIEGPVIDCQVTRVERSTLRARGRHGRAVSNNDAEALVANIVAAFEAKLTRADPEMWLVLDTNDAPAYTEDSRFIEEARAIMRKRGYVDRWAAVWLIGPTIERTTRIFPE